VPEAISKPLITAIIPTYRRPRLLRRAIGSVLAQTYPHLQVCIYDNASGDETPSVVDEMARSDSRLEYHCHPENIGPLKNFIYGMERVETPFFSILSDDDVLLPGFYQTALAGFEKYPEAMLSALATLQMDEKGRILGAPVLNWRPGLYRPPEGLLAMLRYRHPEWTSILFRREIIEKVGRLDEETGVPCDLDFELRAAARLPLVVALEPGAIFVGHRGSHSSRSGFDSTCPGWLKMIRNLVEDERIPEGVRRYASQVLTERLKEHLFQDGLRLVARRNWADAYKSAEVLRNHYHLKGRALMLRTSATACRKVPLAHHVFLFLPALRKLLRRFRNRRLQKRYGPYARQLQL
jgi:glycosyltransferase involved in cell wall biosynthesis